MPWNTIDYLNRSLLLIVSPFRVFRYANRHNPDEESFRNMMAEINNDITVVPELTRNKQSTKHQV